MNAKIVTAAILSVAVLGLGLAVIADAENSAAAIPDGNTYDEETYGSHEAASSLGAANFSDVCLILGIVILIAAAFCIGMAIYTKLYGDF